MSKIKLDTYKLDSKASRINALYKRINSLDGRIDKYYRDLKNSLPLPLWALVPAKASVDQFAYKLQRAENYLRQTSDDFEKLEKDLDYDKAVKSLKFIGSTLLDSILHPVPSIWNWGIPVPDYRPPINPSLFHNVIYYPGGLLFGAAIGNLIVNGTASSKSELKAGHELKDVNKAIKDKLEKEGLREKLKDDKKYYKYDENGKKVEIDEKDAPKFYDREATILEYKNEGKVSAELYKGEWSNDKGKASVTIGEAEAHAEFSAGFYVIGDDGTKKFSPGVKAEVGASVTAFEIEGEYQLVGNEMLGINTEGSITAGEVSAKADATAQIFSEDGKLDIQLGASASAEAIVAEAKGSVGANVLGGEVKATGGVNFGIGAHADIGYRDGVFKCDVGASLGIGVSIDIEVDVGGMVNTVVDGCKSAWEGTKNWVNSWKFW